MDVTVAAEKCRELIYQAHRLPHQDEEYGWDHLNLMCNKIMCEEVTGEKAHRWLGWIQACLCFGGAASLEELKQINVEA